MGIVLILGTIIGAGLTAEAFEHNAVTIPKVQQGQSGQQPAQGNTARTLGTVAAISGNNITLTTRNGDVAVSVPDSASVVRVEPDAKDLKNAVPIHLNEIVVGDRILVFGHASDDQKSVTAARVIAMKKADIDAKHQQDTEEWQKHGVGGLVSAVDPATKTVTISVTAAGGAKPLLIQVSDKTIYRRYAPNSVKFDDAKPSKFADIKVGDQLRARGTRAADGLSLSADEIVTGAFRNISGTIDAVDPAASTITVSDLVTKQPVIVKITSDSQVRKLPAMMAQGIAMRLKGVAPGQGQGQSQAPAGGQAGMAQGNAPGGQSGQSGGGFARRGGGTPDFQSIVNRMPPASLSDFQKGDAVMIVSTEGTDSGAVTAITILGGVEPILAATPKGGQPVTISPWSLGGGGDTAGADAGGIQ